VTDTILITGGAGFIGRYVARALLERGHRVRVLDSFIEQVHGPGSSADHLDPEVDVVVGDVRDEARLALALKGVDKVVHLAAEVGVGQSMYAIDRYVSVNDLGTAVLFQKLIDNPVKRVVVASSMSIYGEGLYRTVDGDLAEDVVRVPRARETDPWDPLDDRGRPLVPVPTPEWKKPALASVYAITKYVQERLTLTLTQTYGMEGVALRLWNVYGPGQALSNPYTGVLAIFASRLLNGKPAVIFEDGQQRRDFVHVEDIAQGLRAGAGARARPGRGVQHRVGRGPLRAATWPAPRQGHGPPGHRARDRGQDRVRRDVAPQHPGHRPRRGANSATRPRMDFEQGLAELSEWVAKQQAVDRVGPGAPGARGPGAGGMMEPDRILPGADARRRRPG
jgi:dTDP-L-rhamnose 4-epimerase